MLQRKRTTFVYKIGFFLTVSSDSLTILYEKKVTSIITLLPKQRKKRHKNVPVYIAPWSFDARSVL